MYGHGQIPVIYREATCIHHFYSILSLFGVCRLIFYVYYYSSCADGHKGLPADVQVAVPSEIWAICQCEDRGNTPLLYT